MRRWPSRPTNVGVVSMAFDLPFLPKVGWWGIKALVNGQEEIKKIRVEKWYTPRFEVRDSVWLWGDITSHHIFSLHHMTRRKTPKTHIFS